MEAEQQQQPPTAVAARRGRRLQPVQTTDPTKGGSGAAKSPQTRPAPPHPDEVASSPTGERIPLRTPKSQSSKSSLRSLFLRPKSSRSSIASVEPSSPLPSIAESQKAAVSSPRSAAAPSPVAPGGATHKSVVPSREPTPQALNTTTSNGSRVRSTTAPTTPEPPRDSESQSASSWHLPPLFKAYPQALKQATLPTPNLSPEMILQADSQSRSTNVRKAASQSDGDEHHDLASNEGPHRRKGGKIQKRSRRRSYVASKLEWCQKHYILATRGRILQYDASGDYDRQPERVMELGKNSIAFASDALPGRHWVLQVSQTVDSKNAIAVDTRQTFMSRIGVSQRVTKTMFLVFENADELASWLTHVRREIELLGGKHFVPEATRNKSRPDLHRYQSLRVNRQSSQLEKPQNTEQQREQHKEEKEKEEGELATDVIVPIPNKSEKAVTPTKETAPRPFDKHTDVSSTSRQHLTEAPSLSTLGSMTELDTLRDGSRSSYISVGTRTMSSSGCSSPAPSTSGPKHATPTKSSHPELGRSDRAAAMSSTEPSNRQEPIMKSLPRSQERMDVSPVAEDGGGAAGSKSKSSGNKKPNFTPNFSVPSFSTRYSTAPSRTASQHHLNPPAKSQPQLSAVVQAHDIRGNNVATGQRETKRNRKLPNILSLDAAFEDLDMPSFLPAAQRPSHATTQTHSTHDSDHGRSSNSGTTPELSSPRCVGDLLNANATRPVMSTTATNKQLSKVQAQSRPRPSSIHATTTPYESKLDSPGTSNSSRPRASNPAGNQSRPRSIPHSLDLVRASASGFPQTQQHNSLDKVSKRRSMPLLLYGPPPCPPPDYPLPEVPSHAISDYT